MDYKQNQRQHNSTPMIGSVAHANNLQLNVSQFYIRPQYPKLIALHLKG